MAHSVFTQNLEGFFNTSERKSSEGSSGSKRLYRGDLEGLKSRLSEAREGVLQNLDQGCYPFLSVVRDDPDQGDLFQVVESFKTRFETVLVLGTGGSSLGGQSLVALKEGGVGLPLLKPHLYFLDNVDPVTFDLLLPQLDLKRTGILIISKSGETTETLVQTLFLQKYMKQRGLETVFLKNTCVITQLQESPLYRFARGHGLTVLPHDPKVGGRFSVFSIVGLFPMLLAGLDPYQLRKGAELVLDAFSAKQPSCEILAGAGSLYLYGQRGVTQTVLMPYIDRLGPFAFWFRQLWAESLGKNQTGLTPIRAMGTVDQHSQLQLYMDGPFDKTFTFLTYKNSSGQGSEGSSQGMTLETEDPELSYLQGVNLKMVLWAEQKATMESLLHVGAPVREICVDTLTEETLGGLYMHFMLETLVIAHLFGIDPLTQPAVQQSKVLTCQYLSDLQGVSHGAQAPSNQSH